MKFEKITAALQSAKEDICKVHSPSELAGLKARYLGKKGALALLTGEIKTLSPQEKPLFGKAFNEAKKELEALFLKRGQQLKQKEISLQIEKESLDMSLPGPSDPVSAPHPLTRIQERILHILSPLGYTLREGPLIETDWNNFTALNIPPHHPSRDAQDTFYIDAKHVLRTHTSPVQIRTLQTKSPPLALLALGPVFRADEPDSSHSPMFHQAEGLFVDKQVSLADLKGLLSYFLKELFGSSQIQVRFRPSFFPFTEPSAEYDMSCVFCSGKACSVCKGSGWIEVGGAGLVHPKVFEQTKVSPEQWQGFAFGLGLERLSMILHKIGDIRLFFQNDLRFLKQF